jgi:hypothetical protein
MLRKTKDLVGARLAAQDGDIGHVKDFYFDDRSWTFRYLVADTGKWLEDRQVLLSPFAVRGLEEHPHKIIHVNLSKAQIEASPSIEEHKPISRQYELEYLQYYGWPEYWPGPLLWGPVEAPWAYIPTGAPSLPAHPVNPLDTSGDAHLRSARDISGFSGYQIQALDQVFGHVDTSSLRTETGPFGTWSVTRETGGRANISSCPLSGLRGSVGPSHGYTSTLTGKRSGARRSIIRTL